MQKGNHRRDYGIEMRGWKRIGHVWSHMVIYYRHNPPHITITSASIGCFSFCPNGPRPSRPSLRCKVSPTTPLMRRPTAFGLPAAQPGDERRSSAGAKQVSANCFTMMWQQDSNYKQYFQFQTVEGLKANVVEVAVRLFDPLMKGKNGKANWPHTTLALVFHWIESVFACPRACCHHVHLLPSNSQHRVNKSH